MNLPRMDLFDSSMARVIGITMVLLFVSTMSLNSYFSLRAAARLKHNLIHHSQSLVRALARSSRIAIFTGNKDQLAATASYMAVDLECQLIGFFDESGTPLQRYKGKGYQGDFDSLADTIVAQHLQENPRVPSLVREVGSSIIIVEPVLTEGRYSPDELFADSPTQGAPLRQEIIIGYVVMMTDSNSIRTETRTVFLRDTLVIVGITTFCCFFLLAVIHYFVAVPMRRLVVEIRRLNENGQYAESQGTASIPHDFSEMITILRTSYNTIYELKNGLEEKVAARTHQVEQSNQELVAQKNALTTANEQLADALIKLRSTQAQLVQSEKMAALGMMISGLSHEIKNSINFIASSVPLLEMTIDVALREGGDVPSLKLKGLLKNIQEGVDRTVQVVTDLATFCHDGGAVFRPTDIMPGLKSAVAIVRREYGGRIDICEDHARALPMVQGMAGQLNQVFLNILLNAAQAIDGQGKVMVRSWGEMDSVHVSIADTGHGIKEQDLGRIFDPFFTTKDVGKGTGLGLSISYTTIKSHGGEILVTPTEGGGSTFEIVLPVGVSAGSVSTDRASCNS